MPEPGRRRITLFDVMALIASTAFGLALSQIGWPRNAANPGASWFLDWLERPGKPGGYPSKTWMLPVASRVAPLVPCLAAWTGAYLASRLHPPRPRRRRLVLQPGLVAAVAALSVLAIESALMVGSAWFDGRFGWATSTRVAEFAANAVVMLAHHAGWAVGVAWLTLALIGRWRPEPTWLDRWGRALGCTWIILGPLASLLIDHATWWGTFLDG